MREGGAAGGGQQHERRDDHGQSARHLDVQENAACKTSEQVATGGAGDDASDGHYGSFGDYSGEEALRRRTERETNAEFTRAGADGEGENASDADQGNGKSDGRKDTEHNGVETIRGEDFGADVF